MGREKLLIVADDLTGAGDTGVLFSKKGIRTIVLTDVNMIVDALVDYEVVVADTESRYDDPGTAYRKLTEVGRIARDAGIGHIYKKMDSTLRGNVGAELSGLMDALEFGPAFVVPALPAQERSTREGRIYVRGKPLEETEFARDPRAPLAESFIPAIISRQCEKPTAVIPLADPEAGSDRLKHDIAVQMRNGIRIMVIDAISQKDLDLIASCITGLSDKFILAGSSGLAASLPAFLDLKRSTRINLVIAGSVSEVTREQVEYARARISLGIIDLDIGRILSGEQDLELARILSEARKYSEMGEDIVIRGTSSRDGVARSYELGYSLGMDQSSVSETIALFLGLAVHSLLVELDINGLLLCGGEVAFKALKQLGIERIILKNELLPGVPLGYPDRAPYSDLPVVTKAGGFGDEDTILKVLGIMHESVKKWPGTA